MDGITLLKDDHRRLEQLFRRFEQTGQRATKTRKRLADRMVAELKAHAALEEQVFYPLVRGSVVDADPMILESLEEHHVAHVLAKELAALAPTEEHFEAKATVLIETVRDHVDSEERQVFPRMRKAVGRRRIVEIGDAMGRLRRKVHKAGSGKAMRKAAKKTLKRVA
jgi:hemerythrin superfamily protein